MPARMFNRWSQSSSFTSSELLVLETLLPQNSSNARLLLRQARQAPHVRRKLAGRAGYQATIPYLQDDSLLVDVDRTIESPSVEAVYSISGRRLRFWTAVLRGGFLLGLKGTAVDGQPWPRTWGVGAEIIQTDEVLNWLAQLKPAMDTESSLAVFKKLATWCHADAAQISQRHRIRLHFAPPASDVQVAQCESRLRTTLANQYKQFVKIANGFTVRRGRPYEVLGTNDIEYLDCSGHWIGLTPLYEEGYVALRNNDPSATCYLLSPNRRATKIGDLRQHVRESLEWVDVGL